MMKRFSKKENLGITLVALVITIIILLILTGITIATLSNSGLFSKSQEAKEKWDNAQDYEETEIGKYVNNIDDIINSRSSGVIKASNIIADFGIESIETNGNYALIKANVSDTSLVKGYIYFLDDKVVAASKEDTFLYDSLNLDTDYKVSVMAIDQNGDIKESNELSVKTASFVLNRYVLIEVKNPDGAGSINELEVYNSNNQKCSYSIASMYDSRTGGGFTYENDPRVIWCSSNLKDGEASFSGYNTALFLFDNDGNTGGVARFIIDLGSATQIKNIKMAIGGGYPATEISTYILPDRYYNELGSNSTYYLNVYYRKNDNLILTHKETFPNGQSTSEWYNFL